MTPRPAGTARAARALAAVAIAALALAAGCSAGGEPGGAAAGDGQPPVHAVAAVKPLAALVEPVLGDRGTVTALVPAGAGHHAYAPAPGDVAQLERADVYFGNGLGLNPAATELARASLPETTPLVRLAEEALDPDQVLDSGPGHTHVHPDGTAHHHRASPNPHTWLSVPLAMAKVSRIAEVLAEVDPGGAEVYRANARAYRDELAALHRSIAEAAATVPADQRTIVTFHEAHRYFAEEYGFELVGSTAPTDFSEPSARQVAELIDLIEAEDVPAMFDSALVPGHVTDAIVAETDAVNGGELSDEVLPGEPGEPQHSYAGLIAHNARLIIGGLGGDPGLVAGP